jgi:hypothetical protein
VTSRVVKIVFQLDGRVPTVLAVLNRKPITDDVMVSFVDRPVTISEVCSARGLV